MIKSMYTKFFVNQTKDEFRIMVETWHEMLQDLTYEQCVFGLKRHGMTNKWPPSIAEIREELNQIKALPTAGEAWEKALKFCTQSYYRYDNDRTRINLEDLQRDEPVLYKALKAVGINTIQMSENISVERAHFLKIYDTIKTREEKEMSLPENLRVNDSNRKMLNEAIKQIAESKSI